MFSAKEKMHAASTLAAIAYSNANLGLAHGIAAVASHVLHLPHGKAAACILTNAILFNTAGGPRANIAMRRYAELAVNIGIRGTSRGDKKRASDQEEAQSDDAFALSIDFPIEAATTNVKALMAMLDELRVDLQLAGSFRELQVGEMTFEERIPEMVKLIMGELNETKCSGKCLKTGNDCLGAYVRPPSEEQLKKLLWCCFRGEKYTE